MPYPPNVAYHVTQAFARVFDVAELRNLYDSHVSELSGRSFQRIIPVGPFANNDTLFRHVVDFVNAKDLLPELAAAARGEFPRSTDLMKAEQMMAMSASSRIIAPHTTSVAAASNLEAQVQQIVQQVDIAAFLDRVARAELCVCRIEIPISSNTVSYGTGFLVANDHILTNWHVARQIKNNNVPPNVVRLRFGYKRDAQGVEINSGRVYGLSANWLLASSPYAPGDERPQGRPAEPNELDYALLAVAGSPAIDSPLLKPVLTPVGRGFLNLAAAKPTPLKNLPMFVLGHPDREPMAISMGRVLERAVNGVRLRHDAYTMAGSSGSPVFNADFELVALHHAGDPADGPAQFNQAIPIELIKADISSQIRG